MTGATSLRANSATLARSASCSSDRRRSTALLGSQVADGAAGARAARAAPGRREATPLRPRGACVTYLTTGLPLRAQSRARRARTGRP